VTVVVTAETRSHGKRDPVASWTGKGVISATGTDSASAKRLVMKTSYAKAGGPEGGVCLKFNA
jgi:hypothetical protein